MRSFGRPDKKAYRLAAKAATGAASAYAEANCAKYFEFQYVWPEAMNRLESDQLLSEALVRSAMLRARMWRPRPRSRLRRPRTSRRAPRLPRTSRRRSSQARLLV